MGKKVAIGAGVAAVGAGAYYFLGPKGKKHQKDAKAWATTAEKKFMTEVGKAEKVLTGKAKAVAGKAMKMEKKIVAKAKKVQAKVTNKAKAAVKKAAGKVAKKATKIAKKK